MTAHPSPAEISARRAAFRRLHESGCFVLPNPWDIGSARALAQAGFKAVASTSSGFAWSQARHDGGLTREQVLDHLRLLVAATELPVNADFENGFASDPDGVAQSVTLAVATGVAGVSIEDVTGNAQAPLYPIEEAVTRIRAARAAIDRSGGETLLVGRADGLLHGNPDLNDAIRRLQAYAEAGADCLYAPGIRTEEEIRAVVMAVSPKPVNVLIGWQSELTLDRLAALGVRRVSVGGALARAAWGGFLHAAERLAAGRFDGFAEAASGADLNRRFHAG